MKSVIHFAYANAECQPHSFSLDYERSLRAAFLKEEFEELARRYLPPEVKVFSTFGIPLLVAVKSEDHPLPDPLRARFRRMYEELPGRYRCDLDGLRAFFGMGGLENDPFR